VGISLSLMLARLYFEPPIVLFDVLWGYFAGSLYDEAIELPRGLWAVRATTVALVATAHGIGWALCRNTRASLRVAWLMLAALACQSYVIEPRWGSRIGHRQIQTALSQTLVRPGLVVHLPGDVDAQQAALLADDHSYRRVQLMGRMGLTTAPVLHSYVYRDARHKAALMGGAGTMIAKPWLGELHIHDTSAPHPLLAHEMVHALAAGWAHGPLKISARYGVLVDMGLTEGLAAALAPDGIGPDLLSAARTLYRMDLALPCRTLLGGAQRFWQVAPARAYTQVGALLRFIEARYGMAAVAALYGTGDVTGVLGCSFEQLDQDLRAWLEVPQKPAAPAAEQVARASLRVPSIFARRCPHEVARLRARAAAASPQEAPLWWQRAAALSHQATTDRLGLAQALLGAGQRQAAWPLLDAIAEDAAQEPAARAQALVLKALSRARQSPGGRPEVAEACAQALRLGAHRGVDRQAWATAWADAQPPDVRPKLLAFLGGELPAPQAEAALAALPHDGTAQYLAGRLAFGRRAYDQALQHLQQAGPHPYTPLEAERLQLMALSAFRLGRRADARRAAVALVALGPASLYGPWAQDLVTRLDAAPHPGPPGEAG
jgi:hypothetical protein